jgi:hypothetical protein
LHLTCLEHTVLQAFGHFLQGDLLVIEYVLLVSHDGGIAAQQALRIRDDLGLVLYPRLSLSVEFVCGVVVFPRTIDGRLLDGNPFLQPLRVLVAGRAT